MSAASVAVETHDCLDHLRSHEQHWEERHGLDCGPYERCSEVWEECGVCGDAYTPREVSEMFRQRNQQEAAA